MFIAEMYPQGRGHSSYRGRGGRGLSPGHVLAQHGKQKLVVAQSSSAQALDKEKILDKDYQEFLAYKKGKTTETFAKIVAEENDSPTSYVEGFSQEVILLIEDKDLKWEEEPWVLLNKYLDKASYATGSYKAREFYENILSNTESCEITHFSGTQKEIYNFSKIYIKKIISVEEWGISPLKQKEFYYNRTPVKFNYFDYIEAFNKVLLYENDKRKHSWFLKISADIAGRDIPNWFVQWWYIFGTDSRILPENFSQYFTQWLDISPKIKNEWPAKGNICSLYFFIEFSIPWIWKWEPEVSKTDQNIPCIKRISYTKFWDKMNKIDPQTQQLYCSDTLDIIKKKLRLYQTQKEQEMVLKKEEENRLEQIKRQLDSKPENKSQLIEEYIEEMKKDILKRFEDETQVFPSDTSMASAEDLQDAQSPYTPYTIEEIFDNLKETLKSNAEASSSALVPSEVKAKKA